MQFSLDTHAQAVRDRHEALRADADAHRALVRTRDPLGRRLRCAAAARLRLPVAPSHGCDGRTAAAAR